MPKLSNHSTGRHQKLSLTQLFTSWCLLMVECAWIIGKFLLMYWLNCNAEKGQNAWTTRFGIAGPDGKLVKPENAVQPDGAKIPWGVGKLVGEPAVNTTSTTTASYSMNSAMASAAENNAAVVIAVSTPLSTSNSKIIMPSIAFASTFLAATLYTLI